MKRVFIVFVSLFFVGWGSQGHKIVSKNITLSFPYKLNFIKNWNDSLTYHSSDADKRKSYDNNEYPKHFIDIDNYPIEIRKNESIIRNLDSLIALYGKQYVLDQGLLPWTILNTYDSLIHCFKRNDLHNAMLVASDLGHYVGDAHMPLHITKNYNGQLTSQSGLHSRYESSMIGYHVNDFVYSNDSSIYIDNIEDYIFNMIDSNYAYVDSLLKADKEANIYGSYNNSYYNELWKRTKNFTTLLFKQSSYSISNLIYSAYLDSQELLSTDNESSSPSEFIIYQNYPNPFNPITKIQFYLAGESNVELSIYNILGQKVSTIIDEKLSKGEYIKEFDGTNLASGIYLYSINIDGKNITNKMLLLK